VGPSRRSRARAKPEELLLYRAVAGAHCSRPGRWHRSARFHISPVIRPRRGESSELAGLSLRRVAGAGGIPPPPRHRSRLSLTGAEREEISRGLANGASLRAVSRGLGRAASTVSREVRRHGGRRQYRASVADTRAWARSRRPKVCRLATRPALRAAVAAKLALEWAPQQIAGWLRHAYPDDPEMHVSHETIYLTLHADRAHRLRSPSQYGHS
jgi:hypothetical protein